MFAATAVQRLEQLQVLQGAKVGGVEGNAVVGVHDAHIAREAVRGAVEEQRVVAVLVEVALAVRRNEKNLSRRSRGHLGAATHTQSHSASRVPFSSWPSKNRKTAMAQEASQHERRRLIQATAPPTQSIGA
jgi:hypothetical protein